MKVEWRNDLPGWLDNLRMIDAELEDGIVVRAELDLYDMTLGPEEHPIFRISVNGNTVNFVNVIRWKYSD